MHKAQLLFLSMAIVFASCRRTGNESSFADSNSSDSSVLVLDFEKHLADFWDTDTSVLNNLAKSIRFIPLEVSSKSRLMNINFQCYRWGDHYIVSSGVFGQFSGVMSYDTLGKFEETLIGIGHGPAELPFGLYEWSVDTQTQELVIQGGHQTKLYSLPSHSVARMDFKTHVSSLVPVADGIYAAIAESAPHSGSTTEPYLSFFTRNGERWKDLYYHRKRDIYQGRQEGQNVRIEEIKHLYSSGSGTALFKDLYNDTIYAVDKGSVSPFLYLKMGRYSAKIKYIDNEDKKKECFYFRGHGLSLSDRYAFINYIHQGRNCSSVWEKSTGRLLSNTIVHNEPGSPDATAMVNDKHFIRYRTPTGRIVVVGIVGVEPQRLYAILNPSDAKDFLPEVGMDSNPILMEVEL